VKKNVHADLFRTVRANPHQPKKKRAVFAVLFWRLLEDAPRFGHSVMVSDRAFVFFYAVEGR
jgi:hypothetical protein